MPQQKNRFFTPFCRFTVILHVIIAVPAFRKNFLLQAYYLIYLFLASLSIKQRSVCRIIQRGDQAKQLMNIKGIGIVDNIGLPVPAFPAGKQFPDVIL